METFTVNFGNVDVKKKEKIYENYQSQTMFVVIVFLWLCRFFHSCPTLSETCILR